MTTLLPTGQQYSMAKDVIYAVPVRACVILTDDVIEVATTVGFTVNMTVSSNTPTTIAGAFARATNATTNVVLSVF